jgi:hypothetical protein
MALYPVAVNNIEPPHSRLGEEVSWPILLGELPTDYPPEWATEISGDVVEAPDADARPRRAITSGALTAGLGGLFADHVRGPASLRGRLWADPSQLDYWAFPFDFTSGKVERILALAETFREGSNAYERVPGSWQQRDVDRVSTHVDWWERPPEPNRHLRIEHTSFIVFLSVD